MLKNTSSRAVSPYIKALLYLIGIFIIAASAEASPAKENKEGIKAFSDEKYEQALTHFQSAAVGDPKSPVLGHNIGVAMFKQKRYDKAIETMGKYLQNTTDSTLLSKLYYNIGNGYFRKDTLTKAIEAYKNALKYNPNDQDAKFNLELARALLKQNSKKQSQNNQQQQQNQQNQQQQKQQNQQQDQQKQEQQQNQQQQKQDQEKNQKQQEQKEEQNKNEMNKKQAKALLNAMEDNEKKQQKQRMQSGGTHKLMKDW